MPALYEEKQKHRHAIGQLDALLDSLLGNCPAEAAMTKGHRWTLRWTTGRLAGQSSGALSSRGCYDQRTPLDTSPRLAYIIYIRGGGRGGRASGRRAKGERKETLALYSSSCPKRCATWTFQASGNHSRPHPIECAPIFFSCTSDGWTVPGHCPARRPAAQLRVCVFASLRKALASQSLNAIKHTR